MTDLERNLEYAQGLRRLADWLQGHPEISPPETLIHIWSMHTKEEAAICMLAMGNCEKHYGETLFSLTRDFGPITLKAVFNRDSVCVRRVVGTRRIEAQFFPAREEEIVEWDCEPILTAAERGGVAIQLAEAT